MEFSVLILKNPIPCLAFTLAVIIYTAFPDHGLFSTLFTISVATLPSILFNLSKQKAVLVKAPLEEEDDDEYVAHMPIEQFSESDSICHSSITDHDSEIDWPCSANRNWSDDGSISDEESLIEIALPSGHFVNSENVWGWKDFSSDMSYEEDNLIEIDLAIGSIKCSRFGIKA